MGTPGSLIDDVTFIASSALREGLAMNWRRGLLRLLIIFDGALLVTAGAVLGLLQVPDPPPGILPQTPLALVGALFFVPTLVLAVAGYAVTWAVRGFR
jgi:hypothetical protein